MMVMGSTARIRRVALGAARGRGSLLSLRRNAPGRALCSSKKSEIMPAPVRWVVVGSGVTMATPLFPVIGLYRLVCYVVPDGTVRIAVFGTFGAIVSFALRDLLPALVEHAEFVAPFALANGLAATVAYAVVEGAAGGPVSLLGYASRILPLAPASLVGAGIGAITAAIAPYTYSSAISAFWGIDLELRRFMDPVIIPVSIPTGIVAGAALGPLMRPAFLAPTPAWTVPLVVAAPLAACFFLYRRAIWFDAEPLVPGAALLHRRSMVGGLSCSAYLSDADREAARSALRADATSGKPMSSVPTENARFKTDDGKLAELGHITRRTVDVAVASGVRVFDDRRSARLDAALRRMEFLEYFVRENLRPIGSIVPADVKQKSALTTDAVARLAYKMKSNPSHDAAAAAEEVIRDFKPYVDLMHQRHLDEDPSSRHLEDPVLLSAAAADALGIVSLLQHCKQNVASLHPDDVATAVQLRKDLINQDSTYARNALFEGGRRAKYYKQQQQDQQLINYAELECILENANVTLPLSHWFDLKRRTVEGETRKRRRRQSLATTAVLFLLYYYYYSSAAAR